MGRKKNDTPEKIAEERIWQVAATHATSLDFSLLNLQEVPESLGQLTALQTLDLGGNQLSALPEWLGQLSELRELYLHDNPALGLPAEVLGPIWLEVHKKQKTPASPKSILDYYFRSRQAWPLNEAKLILVGRGGVGKSSLVDRLIHRRFDPKKKKTEGIQITAWPLKLNGEDVRLHVWNLGGRRSCTPRTSSSSPSAAFTCWC
jgi:internalin A